MNQMEIFKNPEFGSIRTFEQDGKVLFCGKDIAKALGYQRTADAITAHCKGVCVLPTPSNGGIQRMKFIPEGDVYRLIVHSKLPSAERFERWVFDEVLPTISMVIALLGVAVLLTCSLQNGIILLVMAFLISPYGLPMAAIWLLGKVQDLKFSIQNLVYG